ncbi:papain-like cysteine peptidase [Roseomonas sp. HJA6]|uniref:Papain-like cysteine peptidase n=1 Tax=Roseomonas alba TaxID=2846776 RepID=A0ABS7A856_9PROT|nr:DUF1796 family putative cysteine peptidase [Neoroseomonas alba]MBW6397505.1 papain-like cysteine peptidase [Neoroseomonas alba]
MPIVPLASFAGSSIDHLVSLGRACETAYNLRRHYGFATAYPFDWWISTTEGAARFIRDGDAEALYRQEDLSVSADGDAVGNARYGIRLQHEFPRDRRLEGRPVVADWADHLEAPRKRTAHLARRFFGLAATARNIVFVRAIAPRDTNGAAVAALLEALDMRFTAARVAVVLVNYRGQVPAAHPVHRLSVARPAGADWRGDSGAWDAALATLGLRMTPGLHKPATAADLSAHVAARSGLDAEDPGPAFEGASPAAKMS